MARIRSVHPGLASDEAFMSMSMAAKAAWSLLWTECDDAGVFEWKPIVLKARIFPADNVDFTAVLAEYEALNCVRRVELEGKAYGVVRNFGKFQRPKNPSYRFPDGARDPEFTSVRVGGGGNPPPALPQPSPSPPENPPQMKEEGGRKEEERSPSNEGSTRQKRKPGHLAPEDYEPKARHFAWGEKRGLSRQWVLSEAGRMKRWSAINAHRQIAKKSDWDMALDNWIESAFEKLGQANGRGPPPARPRNGGDAFAEIFAQSRDQLRSYADERPDHGSQEILPPIRHHA